MKRTEKATKELDETSIQSLLSSIRNHIYLSIFNALQSKSTSTAFFLLQKIINNLQIIFLLFTPFTIANWGISSSVNFLRNVALYVHITPAIGRINYTVYTIYTVGLCSLSTLGLISMIFVSRKKFKVGGKNTFILEFYRLWLNICQHILFIPFTSLFLLQMSPSADHKTLRYYPQVPYFTGMHLISFSFCILGIITFIPVAFSSFFFYHETNSEKTNIVGRVPNINYLVNFFTNIIYTFVPALYSAKIITIILPLTSLACSIYLIFTQFKRTFYFVRISGRIDGIGSLLYFWTSAICSISAISNGTFGSMLELWIIGIPIVLLIGILGESIQLKPLYHNTGSFSSADRLLEQIIIILQLLNEEGNNESVKMLLDGFVEFHIENCDVKNCPIQILKTNNEDSEQSCSLARVERLLSLIEFLFSEGVKKFENSISLRIAYIGFLVDRRKKRQLALTELKILEELRPSGQDAFFLYLYQKKITEYSSTDIVDEEYEINEVAHEVLVSNLMKSIDLLCCFYFEYWALLNEELPLLSKITISIASIQKEIHRLNEIWEQLTLYSPFSKFRYTSLLSRFFTNIANDFEKGEALMIEARTVTRTIFEKKNNIMNFRQYDSISDVSSPIVVISATIESLGIITEVNQAASAFFRYNSSELVGKNINILLPRVIRDYHQGYLKKAFVDKKKSFNREKPLYALGKDGYLLQIYLTVKLLTGQRNVFLGRVRTAPVSGYTALILTDEEGNIDSFSPSCEYFFGLDSNQIAQRKKIDNLIPNATEMREDLVNRGLVPVPAEFGLVKKDFNIFIDLNSYSHSNMNNSYYVYCISMERIKCEPKEPIIETYEDPGYFNFTLHSKKKKMIARRGISQADGQSQSQTEENDIFTTLGEEKLGNGIKICRLEKGELMHVVGDEGEEVESDNDEEELRKQNIIEHEERNKNEERKFTHVFNLKKTEFRKVINRMKTPRIYTAFATIVLFLFTTATVFACYTMVDKSLKLNFIKNYFDSYRNINFLGNVIQRGLNIIAIRFSNNESFIFNKDEVTFYNAYSANVLDLEVSEKNILEYSYMFKGTEVDDLFNADDISMDLQTGTTRVNFWTGLKNIITQSFVLKQIGGTLSTEGLGPERMRQFLTLYKSSLGEFWTRTSYLKSKILEIAWDSLNGNSIDYFSLIVYISILAVVTVIILIFLRENKIRESNLLLLLIEVQANRVKHFCKKCEIFREIVYAGENEEPVDLDYLVNDNEPELLSKSQRSRLKRLKDTFKIRFVYLIKVIISFLLFSILFGFILYFYSNKIKSSYGYINEIQSTTNIESDSLIFQNRFYAQIYFPDLIDNSSNYNVEIFNYMISIFGRVMKDQMDTIKIHSEYYSSMIVYGLSTNLCTVWSGIPKEYISETPSLLFKPTIDDCLSLNVTRESAGLTSNGITFALVSYEEIIRKLLPIVEQSRIDSKSAFNGCPVKGYMCIFYQPSLVALVKFHYFFFAEITALWSFALLDDISTTFVNQVIYFIQICFLIQAVLGIAFILYNFYPFISERIVDFKRIEFALLTIPDFDIAKSKILRDFVIKKMSWKLELEPQM